MQRFAVILVLLVSLVLLGKGALQSWQPVPLPSGSKAEDRDRRATTVADRPAVVFYPQVPPVSPDLKDGYLFNAERLLDLDTEDEEDEEVKVDPAVSDAQVDIEGLEYVGSIIIGELRRGMVSYSLTVSAQPEARNANRSLPDPRQRSRSTRQQPNAGQQPSLGGRGGSPKRSSGEMKHATVDEGETFFGFVVEQVLPDKIVFEKDGHVTERLLYDPDKERSSPPARQVAANQVPVGTAPQLPAGTVIQQPAEGGAPHFAPAMPGQVVPQPVMAPPGAPTVPNIPQRLVPPGVTSVPVQRPGSITTAPPVRRPIIPGVRPITPPVTQRRIPIGGR